MLPRLLMFPRVSFIMITARPASLYVVKTDGTYMGARLSRVTSRRISRIRAVCTKFRSPSYKALLMNKKLHFILSEVIKKCLNPLNENGKQQATGINGHRFLHALNGL